VGPWVLPDRATVLPRAFATLNYSELVLGAKLGVSLGGVALKMPCLNGLGGQHIWEQSTDRLRGWNAQPADISQIFQLLELTHDRFPGTSVNACCAPAQSGTEFWSALAHGVNRKLP